MEKLRYYANEHTFRFTNTVNFHALASLPSETIEKVFHFAYQMSFGEEGEHRNHRSGGTHKRKPGEIFADAFQGKLAEYAVYYYLKQLFPIDEPSLDVWELGVWESCDYTINNKKISIKSTKKFGQLLLLETKDWYENGYYKHSNKAGGEKYDAFILVRMQPYATEILTNLKILYCNSADMEELKKEIMSKTWEYDIPGFITHNDFLYMIRNDFIICKGDLLNGRMRMDATNYYCQSGDLKSINDLPKILI